MRSHMLAVSPAHAAKTQHRSRGVRAGQDNSQSYARTQPGIYANCRRVCVRVATACSEIQRDLRFQEPTVHTHTKISDVPVHADYAG